MEITDKVNANSFYKMRDKFLYSSDVRENIALRDNVFAPIFILCEVNEIRNFDGGKIDKLSYFEMKLNYETKEIDLGSNYRSLVDRIKIIKKEISLFYEEMLKNERDVDVSFINSNREIKEKLIDFIKEKRDFFEMSEEDFIDLYKRFYRLIYCINDEQNKLTVGENIKREINFYRNIANTKDKTRLLEKKNDVQDDPYLVLFSVFYNGISDYEYSIFNIGMLKREINKLFMLNKLNNEFYNLLIDMHVMSMEELLFSENNLGIKYPELEAMVKYSLHDRIGIIENADRLLIIKEDEKSKEKNTETNIYKNFNLEYYDKVKTLDLINIDFKISDDIDENIKKLLDIKTQENLKFFVVTYLIEHGYINYYKGNKLKNITISTKQEKNEEERTINRGFIYLKLSEKDFQFEGTLELEFEIRLGLKIIQKREKLSFTDEDIKNDKVESVSKILLNSNNSDKNYFDGNTNMGLPRTQVDFNVFYRKFKEYFSSNRSRKFTGYDIRINRDRAKEKIVPITLKRINKSVYCEKIRVNPLTGEIISNSKYNKSLEDVMLHTYLYVYMQSLFLMVKERLKENKEFKTLDAFNFESFMGLINNINVPDTRHGLFRYINYYYFEKYEPFIENKIKYKPITKDGKIIKNEIENIINDMEDYILLAKISEFIYLQILHKFSLENIIDIEIITNDKIKNILSLKYGDVEEQKKESKYIKTIMNYYAAFLETFNNEIKIKEEK